jgi:hypothetical protein
MILSSRRWQLLLLTLIGPLKCILCVADLHSKQECGIYLAPSSIPGAGFGMYAGKAYDKGELVSDSDLMLPVYEMDWHNGHEDYSFLWDGQFQERTDCDHCV